jgi:hypothetical protein
MTAGPLGVVSCSSCALMSARSVTLETFPIWVRGRACRPTRGGSCGSLAGCRGPRGRRAPGGGKRRRPRGRPRAGRAPRWWLRGRWRWRGRWTGPADRGGAHRDDSQGDGGDDQQAPLVVVDLDGGLASQFSPLGSRDDRRVFVKHFVELAQDGDGDVDDVVATCPLDGGTGDCHFGGREAVSGGDSGGRRTPEEQVGKGEHGHAAGQERHAVQDGKAQPGGRAGPPQPARGTGARAGIRHYGSPMR